ncbi:hypothetical protein [Cellulomonas sp. P5_E12]
MDGFELDADELIVVAGRLDAVAELGGLIPVATLGHDRLDAALARFGAAWTRGHEVLTTDAAAASSGLRDVVTATRSTDALVAERLLGLR